MEGGEPLGMETVNSGGMKSKGRPVSGSVGVLPRREGRREEFLQS